MENKNERKKNELQERQREWAKVWYAYKMRNTLTKLMKERFHSIYTFPDCSENSWKK